MSGKEQKNSSENSWRYNNNLIVTILNCDKIKIVKKPLKKYN